MLLPGRLDPGKVNINVSQRIEGSSFAKISNADWVLATELFPDRLIQLHSHKAMCMANERDADLSNADRALTTEPLPGRLIQ